MDATEELFDEVRRTFDHRLAAALAAADEPPAPSWHRNVLTVLGEFLLILGGLAAIGALLALLAYAARYGWEHAA